MVRPKGLAHFFLDGIRESCYSGLLNFLVGEKDMIIRRRLTKKQRDAKRSEWDRQKRLLSPHIKVPRDKIPPLNGETVVIDPRRFNDAVDLIRQSGIKFWEMGRLDEICSRPEHSTDWLEGFR